MSENEKRPVTEQQLEILRYAADTCARANHRSGVEVVPEVLLRLVAEVKRLRAEVAAAEERGRRAGSEEAAKIAHDRWATLRKGSALDRDLDTRMRAQAFEAQAIETHIRALAPRDSGPAKPESDADFIGRIEKGFRK